MIAILRLTDGPRDHVTVPPLAYSVLKIKIQPICEQWARLHTRGAARGYDRQLAFAIRQAIDRAARGVIAVVDRDKAPPRKKLRDLIFARDQAPHALPIALGEAAPHGEAWLLDDPVAVRRGLRLDGNTPIPTVRQTSSPKDAIEQLRRASERADDSILDVLSAIAEQVDPANHRHAHETGFHAFAEDLRHQFRGVDDS